VKSKGGSMKIFEIYVRASAILGTFLYLCIGVGDCGQGSSYPPPKKKIGEKLNIMLNSGILLILHAYEGHPINKQQRIPTVLA